ncbi:MAG: hypothetical protein ACK5JR_07160 [Tropicimonas sp.]|uniref:hypothetical protein n=1 Tax=Tropicimonas sp. TaxID=2067044 RepID=UPI003A8C38B1
MILVFGGRHDPNIGVLADRLAARRIPFLDLRIGASGNPHLRIDLATRRLEIDGKAVTPDACFSRHDVFLYPTENAAASDTAALNWYQAVRGWVASQPGIRIFNRRSSLSEVNKIGNLLAAEDCGLRIPQTVIDSRLVDPLTLKGQHIQKPVAGGEYTVLLGESVPDIGYPRFVQPRLERPEMRIYRIGARLIGFRLDSPELDYRRSQDVSLVPTEVPAAEGRALMRLCNRLDLDFAAADFMTDAAGRLIFLEVNSQPMFAAFDRVAGGALSDAIIDHLSMAGEAEGASCPDGLSGVVGQR